MFVALLLPLSVGRAGLLTSVQVTSHNMQQELCLAPRQNQDKEARALPFLSFLVCVLSLWSESISSVTMTLNESKQDW